MDKGNFFLKNVYKWVKYTFASASQCQKDSLFFSKKMFTNGLNIGFPQRA